MLTEFGKIAYISGPLSQWVRLSYFSSMLQKYIRKVSKGLQIGLAVLCSTSRIQHNWRHWKRLIIALGIGLQSSPPQWLPCIKMALDFKFLNISPIMNLLNASKNPWFIYIWSGHQTPNFLPISSLKLGSRYLNNGKNPLKTS